MKIEFQKCICDFLRFTFCKRNKNGFERHLLLLLNIVVDVVAAFALQLSNLKRSIENERTFTLCVRINVV